ncbi:MAG: hypothetical protein IH994_09765 [Proteobacteria bacterium]|nr:hypothetical protein [Pseudomonadota bacterium]
MAERCGGWSGYSQVGIKTRCGPAGLRGKPRAHRSAWQCPAGAPGGAQGPHMVDEDYQRQHLGHAGEHGEEAVDVATGAAEEELHQEPRQQPAVEQAMRGSPYVQALAAKRDVVRRAIEQEETQFIETLESGTSRLEDLMGRLKKKVIPGEEAFKLYDTYGFPLDLTEDALRGRGMSVDSDGFNAAMERQRDEARKAWAGSGDAATEEIWFEIREKVGATDFFGYETETAEGKVLALVVDGKRALEAKPGEAAAVIVNQTPFYGESGGQVGDAGTITSAGGATFTVTDTQKHFDDLFVHLGNVAENTLKVGDEVVLQVDGGRRRNIRNNHSATHLLHAALRRRLGDHVTQKGSLVAPDRLRFDISHPKAVEPDELAEIEAEVNRQIGLKSDVATRLMDPESAVEAGAMALFGEKYGEEVRVVTMGEAGAGQGANKGASKGASKGEGEAAFSIELCGGTHVANTGGIGVFKIVGESAVAAGVRRIEALTGDGAKAYFAEAQAALDETAALLRVDPAAVPEKVRALLDERRGLERGLAAARRQMATGGGGEKKEKTGDGVPAVEPGVAAEATEGLLGLTATILKVPPAEVPKRVKALIEDCQKLDEELAEARNRMEAGGDGAQAAETKDVGGIKFSPRLLDGVPAKELKSLADDLKTQVGTGVVALVSVTDGKASVVVGVTDDLTERLSAVDLVRAGSQAVGGKGGGGRPDMAQAGGPDGANGQAALDAIEAAIGQAG